MSDKILPHIFFCSRGGTPYIFDPSSGAIVRIKSTKYAQKDEESHTIPDEKTFLNYLTEAGYLLSHLPVLNGSITGIEVEGVNLSIEQFAHRYRRKLTLEITQECNLRCKYCCYGHHYPQMRSHSKKKMSFSVAQMAIDDMLSKRCDGASIGFYGGEPLLEFSLMKRIIEYTNKEANSLGLNVSFAVSTNGTLLTDEIIHFFVANDVNVSISIDGPKESHNRNRVFRQSNDLRDSAGSFDVVQKNINRFIELYPHYTKRGLLCTITSETNIRECDQFFAQYADTFSGIMANRVRTTALNSQEHLNFCSANCNQETCRSYSAEYPTFDIWNKTSEIEHNACMSEFIQELIENPSCQKKHPLLFTILLQQLKGIHVRSLEKDKAPIRCLPGAFALFCSADGSYYPCEKVSNYEPFCLGNVWDGLDINQAALLFRNLYSAGKCDSCPAINLCGLCLTMIQDLQAVNNTDTFVYPESICKKTVDNLKKHLITYVSIMEENPRIFFDLDSDLDEDVEWLKTLRLILCQ